MNNSLTPDEYSLSKKGVWWKILISLLVLIAIGYIFSHYPAQYGGGWYQHLKQPFFAPAHWVPFVMWALVYVFMSCSFGIIWHYAVKSHQPRMANLAQKGMVLFAVHLLFNLIFPVILIGFHLPVVAFIDILILIIYVITLIWFFKRINRIAACLLIPYLLWILYAAALNAAIIVLN